jgi:hypothetical protein
MDMQDKEFDEVFKGKLDGFEAEPSAKVWMGIDSTLDEKSRKKAIMPWLSIAAGIVVLVSAGILFIPKKTTPEHNNRVVKTQRAPVVSQPKQETVINTPALQTQIAVAPVTAEPMIRHTKKIEKVITPVVQPTEVIAKTEAAKTVEQRILAAAPQKHEQVMQPAVPGDETPLLVKQTPDNSVPGQQTKPALIAQQQTPVTKPAVAATPKRRGIHNFGDLVNLVVAKVDKRKDKALEFSDDDEDESTLTAVNIGPVKIKKEDKGER